MSGSGYASLDGSPADPLVVLRELAGRISGRPVVLGISGPQGCGKSTLAAAAVRRWAEEGVRAASLSIDDLYWTRAQQVALAARHPDSALWAVRGAPGTHDVALGEQVIDALCCREPATVAVPRYDKGAHGGRGDRAPVADWALVDAPLDVLLVEGWMVGFVPAETPCDDPDLARVEAALAAYRGWWARLGGLLHLDAVEDDAVVGWRIDAERARRAATGRGLGDEDAAAYVARFLPCYARWNPALRAAPPVPGPAARLPLAKDRRAAGPAAVPSKGR